MSDEYSATKNTQLGQIEGQVNQLTDLFRRRLLNDKVQAQAVAALNEQLSKQRLAPMCREFILLLDRIEGSDDDLVRSVYEEIFEILSHYGLERVPLSRKFNPAVQRIVSVNADDDAAGNSVVEVRRQGYLLGGALLRPQDVVVARSSRAEGPCASTPAPSAEGEGASEAMGGGDAS